METRINCLGNESRVIKEFNNYSVDCFGNVTNDRLGHVIKQCKRDHNNRNNFRCVCLCQNGKKSVRSVHQLVATYWVPFFKGQYIVHHIDKNQTNNVYTNLIWVTPKEHAILHNCKTEESYDKMICALKERLWVYINHTCSHFEDGLDYINKEEAANGKI